MNDPLANYLADHLAGAGYAVELLQNMGDKHKNDSLGPFSSELLAEVEADREVLKGLAERVGSGANGLKELTSWVAEKVSRLKLRHQSADGLDTFESLEFLMLGIHGKWALWRALAAAAPSDVRLQQVDYERLASRAQMQGDQVERRRLELARTTLRSPAKESQQTKSASH